MGALYDEITDPAERKRKLIENGQLMCRQAREALGGVIGKTQQLDEAGIGGLFNTFGLLSSTLRTIGEIDSAQ